MPQFFPKEYNGFDFEKKGRNATFSDPYDWTVDGISTHSSPRLNERPKYSGMTLGGQVKVLNVYLDAPNTDRDALVIAMDVGSNVQRVFYAKDEKGNLWQVNAKATRLAYEAHNPDTKQTEFTFVIDVDDPVYSFVNETVDLWDVLLDEDTHTITVGGNQPTNPTITITPGVPIDYYPFSFYMKNYNPINALQTDAIDITNGGWDTATLVTAGDMLSSGNDVRVLVDGIEVPRWFGGGGMNSATTKIYIRLVWQAGSGTILKLRTALSGVTTPLRIEFQVSKAVKAFLATLPLSGTIRVGNEEISYRNLSSALCQADIVSREIRGTSIAAHSVGDVAYWVQYDIRIIWGNAGASAPVYDETYKPQWDLNSGTNSQRTYNSTTGFADVAGLRAGAWKPTPIDDGKGNLSRVYTATQGAIPVSDPATVMGMEIASYLSQGKAYPDTGHMAWIYEHPAGIVSVESDGKKFKSFSNTLWPVTSPYGFQLQSSTNGSKWVREWNETAPSVANTYEDITNDSVETLPANTKYVRYDFYGSANGLVANFIRGEINESIVILTSANLIQVGFNDAETSYQLSLEIRNNRTEESIFVDYPAAEGIPLIIDTDDFTVTYKGLNAIRGLSWDGIRTRWLRLLPGENELQFFSSVGSVMQIQTSYNRKAL